MSDSVLGCPLSFVLYTGMSRANTPECFSLSDSTKSRAEFVLTCNSREELELLQRGLLGVESIYQQEKFTVPEEEIRKEAEAALAEAKVAKQELDEERLMSQIYETLKASLFSATL